MIEQVLEDQRGRREVEIDDLVRGCFEIPLPISISP
jgi:hypothetical protein